MPYGPPRPQGAADDEKRGLFFVCLNASIARQFEVVNAWPLGGDAFGLEDGDLLTDPRGCPAMTVHGDPPVMLRPRTARGPLVTTRGGEYLFLPGLRALEALAAGEAVR